MAEPRVRCFTDRSRAPKAWPEVIKKVLDIVMRMAAQLLYLLVDTAPLISILKDERIDLQSFQVPEKALAQSDVDDLLASVEL